jgi:hypothetical protein
MRNACQDRISLRQYFIVPEAQHTKSRTPQDIGAHRIPNLGIRMLGTVHFDHKPALQTYKIKDIALEWMLSAEFGAELAGTQTLPKPSFRICHGFAQVSCE